MQDFKRLIKLLCENEVDFVIIGGFAAVVHGVSLLTQDIDLACSFDSTNLSKLFDALKGYNPLHRENRKPLSGQKGNLARFKNLYLITDLGPVDILGEVAGIGTFEKVAEHAIEIDLFGYKCKVLDIEALMTSKKTMGRPKDKESVIQLAAIKERQEQKKK